MTLTRFMLVFGCCVVVSLFETEVEAQGNWQPPNVAPSENQGPGLGSDPIEIQPSQFDRPEPASNENDPAAPYQLSGRFHLQQGTSQGYLVLQCGLPPGSYIHSLTQTGDMNPSSIDVAPSQDFAVSGPFYPDSPATVIEKDPVFQQRVEKHLGKVQFFVPIQIRDGVDLSELKPVMVFSGQVCSDKGVCIPIREKTVRATFAGYFERAAEQPRSNSQNSTAK